MAGLRSTLEFLARTPLHPQWLLVRPTVPAGMSGTVLDIGAADRWIERHLPAGTRYIALDYPATGQQMYRAHPDVLADAARLPFADASIDTVVCLEVIEHVPAHQQVLAEIARVLRPGGKLFLSMPFLYPIHDAPFDFQRLTRHGLQRDIAAAGLQLDELRKTGHAVRTAGLLGCLAIAGGIYRKRTITSYLLLPIAAALILLLNITAYLLSLLWPDWHDMAMGYELQALKA